jgi:hypothetical protein
MDDAILLGIDGTGELDDHAYGLEMHNSFVSYIVRHSAAHSKTYMRGPAYDGLDMGMVIGTGYEFVHLHKVAHPNARVLLTGYSRGAAGVIGVAARLAKDGVRVDGMVLFDPVDRSPTCDTDEISTNVLQAYQLRRMADTFSRVSFNNCGHIWRSPTHCEVVRVWATHGGMGGVPWHARHGERPNDFVSEGQSEINLIHATYDVARVRWIPEPDDHRTQIEFLTERYAVGNHTHVTFHQDLIGAQLVWQHARPQLIKMGFLNP